DGQIQNELLLEAASRGDLVKMMSCLAGGASPAFVSPSDGSSALHLAAERDDPLCVQYLLLQNEALASVTDFQGQTPRDRALRRPDSIVGEMLLRSSHSIQQPQR
ncbi:hypothetical protein BVRB_040760, partial [Beta vulgaris subsp. vulgaris]